MKVLKTKTEQLAMPYRMPGDYIPIYCKTIKDQQEFIRLNTPAAKVVTAIQGEPLFEVEKPGGLTIYFATHTYDTEVGEVLDYVMECRTIGVLKKAEDLPVEIRTRASFQASVWRSMDLRFRLSGFVADVFWKYLGSSKRNIITDSQQSSKGEGFWFARLSEAKSKGYKVYGLDCELVGNILAINSASLVKNAEDFNSYYSDGQDYSGYYKRIAFCK